MNSITPSRVFLTKGVGRHREKLAAFELALRKAGIAAFNLVPVSSIFPPKAKLVTRQRGLEFLNPGQIVYAIISRGTTDEPHRLLAASVGIALPGDRETYGYLSEHHSFGQKEREAGDYAEDLAAEMLATTLGVPFDVDKNWSERKEQFKFGGLIVKTSNITQSAVGKRGVWTTVVAAAVLVP